MIWQITVIYWQIQPMQTSYETGISFNQMPNAQFFIF
jgi:hypothetical protein